MACDSLAMEAPLEKLRSYACESAVLSSERAVRRAPKHGQLDPQVPLLPAHA